MTPGSALRRRELVNCQVVGDRTQVMVCGARPALHRRVLLHSALGLIPALAPLATAIAAASNDTTKDVRLSERPAIHRPECGNPRPYHTDRWWPDANRFSIALSPARDIAEADAQRLSRKYSIDLEGVSLHADGRYHAATAWLEPAQVAALRCEESVYEIGFVARALLDSQTDTPFTIVVRVSADARSCTAAAAEIPCSQLSSYLLQSLKVPPSQPVHLQESAPVRDRDALKALSESLRKAGYRSVTTDDRIPGP